MEKKGIIALTSFFIFMGIISFYFDSQIVSSVSNIRSPFLNNFFLLITSISSKVLLFIFLTALFLLKKENRRMIIPLWFTIFLSGVVTFLLKIFVHRTRPYLAGIVTTLPSLQEASHIIWNFSFPSSHAMVIFSTIPLIWKKFPRFKYLWIIFAILVAFSRVYFGLHFLSDVIFGGIMGYFIGIYILEMRKKNKFLIKIEKLIRRR